MHETVTHTVEIDSTRCTGHGRCYALAPDVFASDEQGFALVLAANVGEDLLDAAERGANACPERAITIRRDAPSEAASHTEARFGGSGVGAPRRSDGPPSVEPKA